MAFQTEMKDFVMLHDLEEPKLEQKVSKKAGKRSGKKIENHVPLALMFQIKSMVGKKMKRKTLKVEIPEKDMIEFSDSSDSDNEEGFSTPTEKPTILSVSDKEFEGKVGGGAVCFSDDTDEEATDDGYISPDEETTIEERELVEYEERKKREIYGYRNVMEANVKGTNFPNQVDLGTRVTKSFKDLKKVIQLVIGQTQSGKTGGMNEVILQYIQENDIPIENIYIIAGLSSKDWLEQTKSRFPEIIKGNIFHNPEISTKFKKHVEGKKNVLVLIDETHMASKKDQTMSKVFRDLGWKLDYMLKNDIKLVQFSATPDGMVFALKNKKWPAERYQVHIMEPGNNYFGAKEMMVRGQVKQFRDIYGRNKSGNFSSSDAQEYINDNIREILVSTLEKFGKENPKYLIFRINGGKEEKYEENIRNTLRTLPGKESFGEIHYYTMDGDIENLCEFLSTPPENFTFVFIKEKMRCSQTLVKQNIGVMVERYRPSPNDSVIIQGFLGRLCGYNEHDVIVYTNLESIQKSQQLWETRYSKESIEKTSWNSNTTKTKCGKTINVPVINDYVQMVGTSTEDDETPINNKRVPVIIEGFTGEEIIFSTKKLKEKLAFINEVLDSDKYKKLHHFINHSTTKRVQITQPKTQSSYKKHIIEVVKASSTNSPYSVDLQEEHKSKNNWQLFIDNREKRLCFVIWSIDKELY